MKKSNVIVIFSSIPLGLPQAHTLLLYARVEQFTFLNIYRYILNHLVGGGEGVVVRGTGVSPDYGSRNM